MPRAKRAQQEKRRQEKISEAKTKENKRKQENKREKKRKKEETKQNKTKRKNRNNRKQARQRPRSFPCVSSTSTSHQHSAENSPCARRTRRDSTGPHRITPTHATIYYYCCCCCNVPYPTAPHRRCLHQLWSRSLTVVISVVLLQAAEAAHEQLVHHVPQEEHLFLCVTFSSTGVKKGVLLLYLFSTDVRGRAPATKCCHLHRQGRKKKNSTTGSADKTSKTKNKKSTN